MQTAGIPGGGQLGWAASRLPKPGPPANLLSMFDFFFALFAGIGAALILGALAFVSLLIGGLINGMLVLISGPVIDKMIARRTGKPAETV